MEIPEKYSLGELQRKNTIVCASINGHLPMQGTIIGYDSDKIVLRESPPLHPRVHIIFRRQLRELLVFDPIKPRRRKQ